MAEKYKLQLLTSSNEVKTTMFTNRSEVVIGSSLHSDIRLQQPSVEDSHVQIHFDCMRIRVFGNNVFLNENVLERDSVYGFRFGDVLRINRHKFAFLLTEPGDLVEESRVIRQPSMELNELRERSSVEDVIVNAALQKVQAVQTPVDASGNVVGSSSVIRQVLEEKKEVLEREIRESIDHPVRDTPVLPSIGKRSVRDLGEAVIEKEILNTAERVVGDKMRHEHEAIESSLEQLKQQVKDNIKDELREDIRLEFMEDVKEDIRDEVKGMLSEGSIKEAIVADVMSQIDVQREDREDVQEEARGRKRRASAAEDENAKKRRTGRVVRSAAVVSQTSTPKKNGRKQE